MGESKTTNSILIIYTGGTIGMYENPETGALENFDFDQLQKKVPELARFDFKISSYAFEPAIDSSDMDPDYWVKIVRVIEQNYLLHDGFVVLHGTDTMAYTASALSFMLENLAKPVILTGSQLPIGQLRTDGKENLLTSLEIAAARNKYGEPMVPEVCIFFESQLMRGNRTTKINAEGFNAFRSHNFPPLAYAGIHIRYNQTLIRRPNKAKRFKAHYLLDSHVIILTLFPGIQRDYITAVLHLPGLKAIIIKTYGSGNAPQKPWFMKLLRDLQRRGVVIINVSQCLKGMVEMKRYETGLQLLQAGVVNGYDGTIESTVTKSMFLLGHNLEPAELRALLSTNIAGEISTEVEEEGFYAVPNKSL